MLTLNHKKLNSWRLSLQLIKDIYKLTESFPKTEVFGISNQMRRASVSIASTIAEGASRSSQLERKRFYQIARSSLVEIDTQIEISLLLEFTSQDAIKDLEEKIHHLFGMTTKMITNTK